MSSASAKAAATVPAQDSTGPANGKLVLISLILVAAVANLNFSVANVTLPSISKAFDASQTQLNLVAVAYSHGYSIFPVAVWLAVFRGNCRRFRFPKSRWYRPCC